MKVLLLVLAVIGVCCGESVTGPLLDPSLGDEWVGPLPDWLWVTTNFSAKGDGIADDTIPIQNALSYAVFNEIIYFPPGTYRITKMLNMTSQHYSTIVGHDPLTTIILYDGPVCLNNTFECVMLYTNGIGSMKFARLTWNGNNKIHTCVQNRWDGCVNGYSGDGIHADEIFTNAYFGIRAGSNHGPYCGPNGATAEWSVTRSQFINLTQAAYSVEDWNALDWFIRQCVFINNNLGITNIFGEGGAHGFENQFFNSTLADFAYGNCGYFSVRDNFSYNSTRFILHPNSGCTVQSAVQRNIVVAPHLANNSGLIFYGGPDVATILDNIFVTPPNYVGPAIIFNGPYSGYAGSLSVNNTFCVQGNVSNAYAFLNKDASTHRGISIGDVNVAPGSVSWYQPTIPGFQPISTRQIFTLQPPSPDVDTAQIQNFIDKAASLNGQRPIVYLPMGIYKINQSLVFQPNSDTQLLGRERASWYSHNAALISWFGPADVPMILIQGPSKVTIKHLTMDGNKLANGIQITNADQVGGRVYVEDFRPYGPVVHNIFANYLDNLHMDFFNLYDTGIYGSTGILSVGGPCAAQGLGDSRIAGFDGATSALAGTGTLYDVKNGGRLSITDTWYEGPGQGWMNLSGSMGSFSFSGGNIAPYTGGSHTLTLDGFAGNFFLNDASMVWNVSVTNQTEDSNVVFAIMAFLASWINTDDTYPPNTLICTLFASGNPNQAKTFLNDTLQANATADVTRILDSLQLLRNARRIPVGPADNRPDGITNVRLFRNWEVFTRIALQIDGDLNQTTCNITKSGPNSIDDAVLLPKKGIATITL